MFCSLCNYIQAKVSNELSVPSPRNSQDISHWVWPPGIEQPSPELWRDVLPSGSVCCSDVQAGISKPTRQALSPCPIS